MNAISLNQAMSGFRIPRLEPTPPQKRLSSVGETKTVSKQPPITGDSLEISAAGKAQSEKLRQSTNSSAHGNNQNVDNLSSEEKAQVNQLQTIDRQTRTHEQAHLGAAGGLARGGASYSYTKGPDGRLYAVSGEVSIDTSPVPGNPEATIQKAETIRRAALAPSEPSSADKAVAAAASKMANEAKTEKSQENKSDIYTKFNPTDPTAELGALLDQIA